MAFHRGTLTNINCMKNFSSLSQEFETYFKAAHFPAEPEKLYDASRYILALGGKRIRPVCVLMGNELFTDIHADAFNAATAIELFHNFSLVHDDIMDKAPLRRGMPTVHVNYGESTALLCGDVMLVAAYDYLNKVKNDHFHHIIHLFNKTAREVCEGQQMDMDFESREAVSFEEYEKMITLKTSVLLASSLQIGAIIGGAGDGNQQHLYEFGKNLGMAFQVQDDYLDAFGDPEKFGKQVGGDILSNKKTFLLIHALSVATGEDLLQLQVLLQSNAANKVEQVLNIFKKCKVDTWAEQLKEQYYKTAMVHLEKIAVLSVRKKELQFLAEYLLNRQN